MAVSLNVKVTRLSFFGEANTGISTKREKKMASRRIVKFSPGWKKVALRAKSVKINLGRSFAPLIGWEMNLSFRWTNLTALSLQRNLWLTSPISSNEPIRHRLDWFLISSSLTSFSLSFKTSFAKIERVLKKVSRSYCKTKTAYSHLKLADDKCLRHRCGIPSKYVLNCIALRNI